MKPGPMATMIIPSTVGKPFFKLLFLDTCLPGDTQTLQFYTCLQPYLSNMATQFTSLKPQLYSFSLPLRLTSLSRDCTARFEMIKKGVTYIVMEKIDGQPLSDCWHEASRDEKDRLLTQLRNIFQELRALKKPAGKGITDGAVCAADGGKLHDHRIWNAAGEKGLGPFLNDAAFNLFLRNGVSNIDSITDRGSQAEIQKLVEMHTASKQRDMGTVFTHGDVSLSNILVKEGKVAGIVVWEMSGWYQRYWEYTTAINTHYIKGWREEIGKFLDEWPQEKEMDRLWRKHYCDGA